MADMIGRIEPATVPARGEPDGEAQDCPTALKRRGGCVPEVRNSLDVQRLGMVGQQIPRESGSGSREIAGVGR